MRLKMRQNPQAASRQCSADLVRTCWSAAEVGRRPAGLIFARSRTISNENFCGTEKNFEKFLSETRLKMRQNPHPASCQCSGDLVGTCWSAAEVGCRPAGRICARSRTISDENFCGTEKNFRKFSIRNASKFAPQPACRIVPVLRRPCEDLQACCGGRPSSGRADFCAISHDFG